jgi:hypothetical protein
MTEDHLVPEIKVLFLKSFSDQLDEIRALAMLGADDEAFVEGLVRLQMSLANVSRQVMGYHPDLQKLFRETSDKLGFVGPLDETKPMDREAVMAGYLGDEAAEEEEAISPPDTSLMKTLAMLGKPKEAEEPEEDQDSIVEAVASGRHKRPQAS